MAFTFAHPAIFMSTIGREAKYISSSALIIGAMAPDFEYFLFFEPKSIIGHQFSGFILLNLPLTFLLYFIWYFVVKKTLLSHAPAFIGARLSFLYDAEFFLKWWRQVCIFAYSAVIGMTSHVLWDSFTHDTGFFVERIAFLRADFFGIYIYKYLQHGSTLLGFVIILFFINKMERQELPIVKISEKIKFFVILSFLFGLISYILVSKIPYKGIGTLIIILINALLLATVGAVCTVFIKNLDSRWH